MLSGRIIYHEKFQRYAHFFNIGGGGGSDYGIGTNNTTFACSYTSYLNLM
jgi:hypothetical protein